MVTLVWTVIGLGVLVGFYYDAKYKRELAELDEAERLERVLSGDVKNRKIVDIQDYR